MLEYCAQGKTVAEAASLADAYIYANYQADMGYGIPEDVTEGKGTYGCSVVGYNYDAATQYTIIGDKNARLDN